jgi:hypothetical protein
VFHLTNSGVESCESRVCLHYPFAPERERKTVFSSEKPKIKIFFSRLVSKLQSRGLKLKPT